MGSIQNGSAFERPLAAGLFRDFRDRPTGRRGPGDRSPSAGGRRTVAVAFALCVAVVSTGSTGWPGTSAAAEPTPPRAGLSSPRTGTTTPFGSGSITRRSDGTTSETRPFGSGSITTERRPDGRTVTGQTQRFGSGTITRWSDGTTTETRPFGSGSITTERGRDGRTVTGHTQKFGNGTITTRSDGSSSRAQPFGSGSIQRDQPGRAR